MTEKQSFNVIYSILIVTALCLFPLSHLKIESNLDTFFPIDDSDVEFYQKFREQFHSDVDENAILIGLENSNGIFQPVFLKKTDSLSNYIQNLNHISKVYSLTNSNVIYFNNGQFNARPLIHISQPDYYIGDSINLFASREYRDLLVSKNAKTIAIAAFIDESMKTKEKDNLLTGIQDKINQLKFEKTHVVSKISMERAIIKDFTKDITLYVVITLIILGISLFILYNSFHLILITIGILASTIIWTLSFMSLMNVPLNICFGFLPFVLLLICVSSSVHFISTYLDCLRRMETQRDAVQNATKRIGLANILSALVLSIGFFTLTLSNIIPIRNLGLYSGIGIILSSLLTTTILLTYFRISAIPKIVDDKTFHNRWNSTLDYYFKFITNNKNRVIGIFTFIVMLSIYFAEKIEINSSILQELPKQKAILEDYKFMENDFYGARSFELALIINNPGKTFFDLTFLKQVEEIENYLRDSCNVAHLISPVSLFNGTNKAYQGGSVASFKLPDSQDEINRYAENIMQTQYADDMQRYLLSDGSMLRISGRMPDIGMKEFNKLETRFESYFKSKLFDTQFSYKMTGPAILFENVSDELSRILIPGLIITFVILTLIGLYLFGFWFGGILILVPNMISLLFISGIMGMLGIFFNSNTAIIICISIGITAINTIHFICRLKNELAGNLSLIDAVKNTFLTSGKLLIIVTFVLLPILLSLMSSDFEGLSTIGLLLSVNLFASLILNLMLLPILFLLFSKKNFMQKI